MAHTISVENPFDEVLQQNLAFKLIWAIIVRVSTNIKAHKNIVFDGLNFGTCV